MQLSPHFADIELGVAGCSPEVQANAIHLCNVLLEPIRAEFGPIAVDDGYRDVSHNARVGGAADSQHLYLGDNSAADIRPLDVNVTLDNVFDWLRLESHLPFDQAILEVNPVTKNPATLHISYNGALDKQRRMALTGETNGAGAYSAVQVNP
jgi:Peptidase M15